MSMQTCFMARQPVVDRQLNLVGYELLFRSADVGSANVTDTTLASAQVISDALSGFGFKELVGQHRGFINLAAETLLGEAVELLPKEQVVLEILEDVEITGAVVARCRDLKRKGFRIALDDHRYGPEFEPLYPLIDIIKVDLLQHEPGTLAEAVAPLKRLPVTLLAEKVETYDQFRECAELGFELFQGYFFAKPVVLKQKRVDIAGSALLRLLQKLMDDADIGEIEEIYRQNPNLTYNLLKLVNSVSMGLSVRITSLRHAISLLGRRQLIRWTQLAMYARGSATTGGETLLELSAMRGRLMELLVIQRSGEVPDPEYHERAFMTGVLSLIDVVFDVPMELVLSHITLSDDVRLALLYRNGELGALLHIAELIERSNFTAAVPYIEHLGISSESLLNAQVAAIRWISELGESS